MRVPVSAEYKTFIAAQHPDLDPRTTPLEAWPAASGRVQRGEWATAVGTIYGAASFAKQLASKKAELSYWDTRLLRYAYVVGRTDNHDPIVQVTSGRYAGDIILVGIEGYFGWFDEVAKPLLAKRGTTVDDVIEALLEDFLIGERICGSFADLYATVRKQCERNAPLAPASGRRGARTLSFTEIQLASQMLTASNGVAYVGDGGVITALRPGRTPARCGRLESLTHLAAAGSKLFAATLDAEDGGALAVSNNGGRTFKTARRGRFRQLEPAADGGVWMVVDDRLVHYRTRFRESKAPRGEDVEIGGAGADGTYVFRGTQLFLVGRDGRARTVAVPVKRKITAVVVTPAGTILVVTVESGVLRSTNGGKTWRTLSIPGQPWLYCALVLSSGAVVIAGETLLLSVDDGQSFGVVANSKLKEYVKRLIELGDELLLGTDELLYTVSIAELLGDRAGGKNARRIRPLPARAAPKLRPLSAYPAVVREPIQRIEAYDRTQLYVASANGKRVRVLENGSREVLAVNVARDGFGRFSVARDWLVWETYPREAESEKRDQAAAAARWGTGRTVQMTLRTP